MTQSQQPMMSSGERTLKLWFVAFLFLHLLPLVAGSTDFTIFTFLRPSHSFTWIYFDLSYSNGFGYVYHSDYTLRQVLAYLVAYASGMVLYPRLARPAWVAFVAVILCGAGLISFLIEGSHYVMDHHFSLIASVPIVLIPIALWTIWKCMRQPAAQVAR